MGDENKNRSKEEQSMILVAAMLIYATRTAITFDPSRETARLGEAFTSAENLITIAKSRGITFDN